MTQTALQADLAARYQAYRATVIDALGAEAVALLDHPDLVKLNCYKFDDHGGITFYVAAPDMSTACSFAASEECCEEVDNYHVRMMKDDELAAMKYEDEDEDEGPTTMRSCLAKTSQVTLLGHSEI